MKYLFIPLIFACSIACADSVVFYDKNSGEVKFVVTDAQKVVLSADDAKNIQTKVIKGKLELDHALNDYKVSGNDVVLNTKKISDRQAETDQIKKNKDDIKASIASKLKTAGLTDQEVDYMLGGK